MPTSTAPAATATTTTTTTPAGTPLTELFATYHTEIAQVKLSVQQFLVKNTDYATALDEHFPLDDLCVVKYLLSAAAASRDNDVAITAADAIIATLRFRLQHHAVLLAAAKGEVAGGAGEPLRLHDGHVELGLGGAFLRGCELVVLRRPESSAASTRQLVQQEGEEALRERAVASCERVRVLVDAESRNTNHLCKAVCITDLSAVSLLKLNAFSTTALGLHSPLYDETHLPQLVSHICLANAPTTPMVMSSLLGMSRAFVSRSTMDKVAVVFHGKSLDECAFTAAHYGGSQASSQLPKCMGGTLSI